MKCSASQTYMIMRFMTSFANTTMFTTYAIYYIAALGLNPFELLVVGMVLEVTVLLFEGITGVVADTYSRRLSIIVGMFVLGCGFALQGVIWPLLEMFPYITLFFWVLLAQVFYGLGHTFVSGADSAWIADEVGEQNLGSVFLRSKRYSLIATLIGIGLSVALSTLGSHLPYLVGGLMYVGLGFFLILFMKESGYTRRERKAGSSHWQEMKTTWLSGVQVVRSQPILLLILIVTIFSGAASEGYDRLREAHLIMEVGFPRDIPLSMAVWFGLIAALSAFLSLIAVRITEKRLTGLRVAALLSFALAPSFGWAIVSLLLIGVIESISSPLYDTWLNLNVKSGVRATVLSMMSQSDALGETAGGPIVGWIGNRISVRASLVVAAVLLSPILVVFGRVLRRR
jgi:MFS family permease